MPWPTNAKKCRLISRAGISAAELAFIARMFPILVCLCAVVSACSYQGDLLPPSKGVSVPGSEPGDRSPSDYVQPDQVACRGFFVVCAVWQVRRLPNRPNTPVGDAVRSRGQPAR